MQKKKTTAKKGIYSTNDMYFKGCAHYKQRTEELVVATLRSSQSTGWQLETKYRERNKLLVKESMNY